MRLLVIGGVAAGMSAAARARRLDPALEITVLESGPSVSHGACGLPYFVEGLVPSTADLIAYTPEYFARERNIQVRTGTRAERIEHARRQVLVSGGETVRYDKLVVATGARAAFPIPRGHNVFTLNTPSEAEDLRAYLVNRKPQRGVVIGAGYMGLEAAEALRTHGVSVRILDDCGCVLGRHDDFLLTVVRRHLERFGVSLELNRRVAELSELAADVIVVAAGLMPNVELAREAGIEIGRTGAIRVDERLETNLPGVYAAGDCAETNHIVTGRPVWIPLGTTANKMGRVAGANAAGARERFPGVAGTSIVRVCGLGIASTGLCVADARANGFDPASARIEARDRAGYFHPRRITVELVADRRSRRLLGATILGEGDSPLRINAVAAALTGRLTVEDFAQLDFAYAPPYAPVWDPLLVAAQQLMHSLAT